MKPDGIEKMWKMSFPGVEMPESVRRQTLLAPGDFNAVYNQVRYLPEAHSPRKISSPRSGEQIAAKDVHGGRTLGFVKILLWRGAGPGARCALRDFNVKVFRFFA